MVDVLSSRWSSQQCRSQSSTSMTLANGRLPLVRGRSRCDEATGAIIVVDHSLNRKNPIDCSRSATTCGRLRRLLLVIGIGGGDRRMPPFNIRSLLLLPLVLSFATGHKWTIEELQSYKFPYSTGRDSREVADACKAGTDILSMPIH